MADEPAAPARAGGLVRVRLDIAYDGTDFAGWAIQPGQRTVQGVLEHALCTVLRVQTAALTVAGRTDAGVHATGQVAHVDVPSDAWDESRLVDRLASLLPDDVRVRQAVAAPPGFEARFAALWRRYEYRICDTRSGPDPLRRRFVLGWRQPLDESAMAAAAAGLLGLNDFGAFCRRRHGATTVRTLQALDIVRDGVEIECGVRADAFCHSMVRALIGSLIAVGDGRRPIEWPASLLGQTVRADDVTVAPAHGLTLVQVRYPAEAELAARARETRARRTARSE